MKVSSYTPVELAKIVKINQTQAKCGFKGTVRLIMAIIKMPMILLLIIIRMKRNQAYGCQVKKSIQRQPKVWSGPKTTNLRSIVWNRPQIVQMSQLACMVQKWNSFTISTSYPSITRKRVPAAVKHLFKNKMSARRDNTTIRRKLKYMTTRKRPRAANLANRVTPAATFTTESSTRQCKTISSRMIMASTSS